MNGAKPSETMTASCKTNVVLVLFLYWEWHLAAECAEIWECVFWHKPIGSITLCQLRITFVANQRDAMEPFFPGHSHCIVKQHSPQPMPTKLWNDGQRVKIVFTCRRFWYVTRAEQSSVGHHPGIPSSFLMCGSVVRDKTTSQFAIAPKKASILPTIERIIASTVFFQKRRHTIHVHPLGYNPCNEICIFRSGRDDLYIHLITSF